MGIKERIIVIDDEEMVKLGYYSAKCFFINDSRKTEVTIKDLSAVACRVRSKEMLDLNLSKGDIFLEIINKDSSSFLIPITFFKCYDLASKKERIEDIDLKADDDGFLDYVLFFKKSQTHEKLLISVYKLLKEFNPKKLRNE